MTELEKLQRAKMYMDKLANGIDPITDSELPQDTALNNVRLSRCFFYVSDILRQVIENGGVVGKREKTKPFHITPEDIAKVNISGQALPIMQFCRQIYEAVNDIDMQNLKVTLITEWLTNKGYLKVDTLQGKNRKRPGERASELGIFEEARTGSSGEYMSVLYPPKARQFILDNLIAILQNAEK